jgi:DNA-binding response OmpR family regulator
VVRRPRRVMGEATFTPCVLRHEVSWFRAFMTAAGVEAAALAWLGLLPLPGELPQAASVNMRSMATPAAASRPGRRLFLVKGFPSYPWSGGPRGAGRLGVTVQRSGGKTGVNARFYAELTVRGKNSSRWVMYGPLTGRRSQVRVLVVEDAQPLAEAIAAGLRDQAIAADVAFDGATAEEQLAVNDYDVVILDRDLPLVHGDDICRSLASSGAMVRILMLTAAGDLSDRVEGLGLGADDYLAKPFAFAELVARVRALGRRARPPDPPVLERAGIRLDPSRQEATRNGRLLPLRHKELAVLAELLRGGGAVVSAEQLLEKAWDENIDPFTHVVRVTIMTLRRKLGEPPLIETVPGAGYRIP